MLIWYIKISTLQRQCSLFVWIIVTYRNRARQRPFKVKVYQLTSCITFIGWCKVVGYVSTLCLSKENNHSRMYRRVAKENSSVTTKKHKMGVTCTWANIWPIPFLYTCRSTGRNLIWFCISFHPSRPQSVCCVRKSSNIVFRIISFLGTYLRHICGRYRRSASQLRIYAHNITLTYFHMNIH